MGKPAARISDMHTCPMVTPGVPPVPHVGGPVMGPGMPTVLIGGLPAAVMGDMCTCVGPPDSIVLGSMGVMIGGKPAARMGDLTAHGGTIVAGLPTVLIGETSPGAPPAPVVVVVPSLVTLNQIAMKYKDIEEKSEIKFEYVGSTPVANPEEFNPGKNFSTLPSWLQEPMSVKEVGNMGFSDRDFEKRMGSEGEWIIGNPWCMSFVQLCVSELLGKDKFKEYDAAFTPSVQQTFTNLKNLGFTVHQNPEPGDIAIWEHIENGKKTNQGHTGIVESVSSNDKTFNCIEGNTNASGGREGDRVASKKRDLIFNNSVKKGLRLLGFIRISEQPRQTEKATLENNDKTTKGKSKTDIKSKGKQKQSDNLSSIV